MGTPAWDHKEEFCQQNKNRAARMLVLLTREDDIADQAEKTEIYRSE